MDPILVKAIRTMLAAQRNASAAGVQLEPTELEQFLREETGGKYGLTEAQRYLATIDTTVNMRNLGRSAAQGLGLNFADELVGLVQGEGAKEDMRLREEMFREEHPYVDVAANVVGSVPTMFIPGMNVAKGASLAKVAARGAAAGAAMGTVAGAGSGTDARSRVRNAGVGGVAGAAFGAAIPAVATGAKRVFSPAALADRRLRHAVNESGGVDEALAVVDRYRKGGRGKEMMAADLNDRIRAEADFAVNNSDDAMAEMAAPALARQRTQADRLLTGVRDRVGDPISGDDLATAQGVTSKYGKQAYGALREANQMIPVDDVRGLLERPIVKRAWSQAQQAGYVKDGLPQPEGSFAILQELHGTLDDLTTKAYRDGRGNLADVLKEAREEVEKFLQKKVPEWEGVNAQYKGLKDVERAVEEGVEWFRAADTRALPRRLEGLMQQPEALEALRRGIASELIVQLRNRATNRNVASEIVDAAPTMQDKLQAVFGSKDVFEQYMQEAGLEKEMAKLLRGPLGGPATARRLAARGFDPAELATAGAATAVTGGAPGLAAAATGAIARGVTGSRSRNAAKHLGTVLSTQGDAPIERMLKLIKKGGSPFPLPVAGRFASLAMPYGATQGLLDFVDR